MIISFLFLISEVLLFVIVMKDICKRYPNGSQALIDVNIHIKQSDFVFIVGSSGAGKSTFIKMLFREVLPSSGTLYVNNFNDIINEQ